VGAFTVGAPIRFACFTTQVPNGEPTMSDAELDARAVVGAERPAVGEVVVVAPFSDPRTGKVYGAEVGFDATSSTVLLDEAPPGSGAASPGVRVEGSADGSAMPLDQFTALWQQHRQNG